MMMMMVMIMNIIIIIIIMVISMGAITMGDNDINAMIIGIESHCDADVISVCSETGCDKPVNPPRNYGGKLYCDVHPGSASK